MPCAETQHEQVWLDVLRWIAETRDIAISGHQRPLTAIPPWSGSRTFSAHITSPPPVAGLRPVPRLASGRPLSLSRPAAGAARAAGTYRQPRYRPNHAVTAVVCDADPVPCVDGVGPVPDGAMLSIGVPAPRSARHCPQSRRQRGSSWSGVQAPCPVYVRLPDRLNASALLNAAIRRTGADKPQVSSYLVRLKSGRSPVRSRPWPPRSRQSA